MNQRHWTSHQKLLEADWNNKFWVQYLGCGVLCACIGCC